eukprot:2325184-Rhodomonas_salina.2
MRSVDNVRRRLGVLVCHPDGPRRRGRSPRDLPPTLPAYAAATTSPVLMWGMAYQVELAGGVIVPYELLLDYLPPVCP